MKKTPQTVADHTDPPKITLDLPYRLCGSATQREVKEKIEAAIFEKMPRTPDGKIEMKDRGKLEDIVRTALAEFETTWPEAARARAEYQVKYPDAKDLRKHAKSVSFLDHPLRFTGIVPRTKPDLNELIELLAMRKFNHFRYYGLRALPPGEATATGMEAFPSYVWVDGKQTEERERGAGAIMIPAIAECEDFAAWQRGFNRGFNLLRQYALMHCDESPLRMYKLLVLGSNEAEPLNEDFEISMIDAKALAVYRLACVAPASESDKPRRALAPPEPPRMFLAPGTAIEGFEQVRHAIGEHMPEEFSHPAALMTGEIGDPNKLW